MTASPTSNGPLREVFDEVRRATFGLLLTRGILAVLLGILLLVNPLGSSLGLIVTAAIFLIVDGIMAIVLSVKEKGANTPGSGASLAVGILAILTGVLVLIWPGIALGFAGLMAAWFLSFGMIVTGVAQFGAVSLGGWRFVIGIIDIVFGVWLLALTIANPGAVIGSLIWVAGVFALASGIFWIVWAFRIRKRSSRLR